MVPCENCIVLAICQGIISDGKQTLTIYQDIADHVDMNMKLPMKFKSLLTQEHINTLVYILIHRCSTMSDYLEDEEHLDEERYWNVRHFYNLNQGEYYDDITVV